DDPYLFTIGQCLPKKNFHVLLPFVKLLEGRYKLIIAGESDTAYGAQLRKLIDQLKLRNIVYLPGPVSEAEKQYLYQHCSAFVFPSLAEGFGLPVVEAMLNKKPVFCSDRTSLKEIGSTHAFFWHSFEPDYMREVFEQGMLAFNEEKSEAAYQYAQQFTWQKNAEEYYKLYRELLQEEFEVF
ncbi:MAG TPA: glycosyltransferase, partial [Bacteroidales bacterium]|nr:glycosyltransferase [Bacteroidales bacterium]